MVGHPEDLFLDTSEMLDRIRPKQRYDIALVAAAAVLDLGIVWGAVDAAAASSSGILLHSSREHDLRARH